MTHLVTVMALVVGLLTVGADQLAEPATTASHGSTGDRATTAAQRFLDRYVEPDGRVVRRDQGGDTVSEGHAYAMLLAVAVGDRERFDAVWRWARDHLRRPDGLLAWRWAEGRVVDTQAAADADLDAAHALVLAARRFHDRRYALEGAALGESILDHETVDHDGALHLVAGPWATGEPAVLNPSYLSPEAARLLFESDWRWRRVLDGGRATLAALTADAPHLVSDWARLTSVGVEPSSPPGSTRPALFGLDAARTLVRYAVSCDREDRALAARAWPFFRRITSSGSVVAAYRLDGRPATDRRHALLYVAAAASAAAAGADDRVGPLLDAADRLHERGPSYYGAAWTALGRVLLDDRSLGRCP